MAAADAAALECQELGTRVQGGGRLGLPRDLREATQKSLEQVSQAPE